MVPHILKLFTITILNITNNEIYETKILKRKIVEYFNNIAEYINYEEKKLKMRKAMGENLYDDVEGEGDDSRTRRLKLLQATEGDDWSNVIDGQTKATIQQNQKDVVVNEEKVECQSTPIVSPFDEKRDAESLKSKGLYSAETFELSVENVDTVLNDVRPYLIADGGNVEVVSVENGIVSLRLQGSYIYFFLEDYYVKI